MSVKYDVEYMIQDLENLFKAELNNAITAVNTEKGANPGDSRYLDAIPTDKYKFETLDKSLLNYKGFFVLFGLVETPVRDANEASEIEDTTVTFQIATFDSGQKDLNELFYKFLRYQRALRKVIKDNPDVFRGFGKPILKSLKPDAFPYDTKRMVLTIGIDIKASITGN